MVCGKWEELDESEQLLCSKISNFCGLHLLINFAENANTVLLKYEETVQLPSSGFTKENGAVRLVRTTAKALGKRGDEKSGAYSKFKDFISDKLDEKVRLEPFSGNRFNILFVDGGVVYYYRNHIVEFLDKTVGTTNKLLSSVLKDCKVHHYIAAMKALGLVEKLVTTPLWKIIESKCHIIEMNVHYRNLLGFLESTSQSAAAIQKGESPPFPDFVNLPRGDQSSHKCDRVLQELLTESEHDNTTEEVLQVLFTSWAVYLKRAVKEHLPGGDHTEPTPQMMAKTKSVPKHNKFSESIFGILHHLSVVQPNASILANEAFVLFSLNKTHDWLENKSSDERN